MKIWPILLLVSMTVPALAVSGEMQKATVHSMRKVPCLDSPSAVNPYAYGAAITGVPAVTGVGDCVEYELRTAKVSYVIQPRRTILLLVGGDVSIKLAGGNLLLQTSESNKDIRCDVLSMTLLSEVERKENQNHAPPPLCVDQIGRVVACPAGMKR